MADLIAKFRPGDAVRWNAIAHKKPEDRCNVIVEKRASKSGGAGTPK